MLWVIGGTYGEGFYANIETTLTGEFVCLSVKSARLGARQIVSVEKIDDINKRSVLKAISGAAIGSILAGPVGMVVGGLLGAASTKRVVFLVRATAGMNLLCLGDAEQYHLLLGVSLRRKTVKQHAPDLSFLQEPSESAGDETVDEATFACPSCQGQMTVPSECRGSVANCPFCAQPIAFPPM